MGFSGFWMAVLRGILGWRRGVNGQFYPEIPGGLRCVRVQRGDSAHGGHGWAVGAKKILKIFIKRGENPKNWGERGAGRWRRGTLYRACGVIFGRDF